MSKVHKWIGQALAAPGDGCIAWPFSTCPNGYGKLRLNKKYWLAHRYICTIVHGDPFDGAQALHSCGNGSLGCVNPNHLRWGTAKENTQDIMAGGTFAVGSRANKSDLTDDKVRLMRQRRAAGKTYQVIADEFGVSIGAAHMAINGNSWAHVL